MSEVKRAHDIAMELLGGYERVIGFDELIDTVLLFRAYKGVITRLEKSSNGYDPIEVDEYVQIDLSDQELMELFSSLLEDFIWRDMLEETCDGVSNAEIVAIRKTLIERARKRIKYEGSK